MIARPNTTRLGAFIRQMTELVGRSGSEEAEILQCGRTALQKLVASDDWLPEFCAAPAPTSYSQYLLYCDPIERFSVVSFVWGPGQKTPIHDHCVWGLIGMLRGAEISDRYELGSPMSLVRSERLEPGMVEAVSPTVGDIHEVRNAFPDRASISIHVYGSNIGATERHVFDPLSGARRRFVSGYCNDRLPNPWIRPDQAS